MVLNSETLKDLESICISAAKGTLLFIVDQFNALEIDNKHPENNQKKRDCQDFFEFCCFLALRYSSFFCQ